MDLFYCGSQWGYTPVGRVSSIPGGYCNPPTFLSARLNNQFVVLTWYAPHDYLYFLLQYRKVGDLVWTEVPVYGISYALTLDGLTEYEWQVRTHCEEARFSTWAVGPNFTTENELPGCSVVGALTIEYDFENGWIVTWVGTGAAYYVITVTGDSAEYQYTTSGTRYIIPNTIINQCYSVVVTAHCADGSVAPDSPASYFCWKPGTCKPPTSLTYTAGSTSAVVGWMPGSIDLIGRTYNVYLDGKLVAANYPDVTFSFSGLTPGTTYLVEVRANCGTDFSRPASVSVVTLPAACNEPAGPTAIAITATSATLNWVPGSGINSQELIINGGTPIPLGAGIATYAISGMPSGSVVGIIIRSICNGLPTSGVSYKIPLLGCGAVTGLALSLDGQLIKATWNPVANALYYLVSVDDGTGAVEQMWESTIYHHPNPTKGTTYDFSVKAVCQVSGALVEGTADTDSITINADPAGNCMNYVLANLRYINATTVGFDLQPPVTGHSGQPIRLVVYANGSTVTPLDTKIVYSAGYYELSGLTAGNQYDIYAYAIVSAAPVLANPLLDGCTLNTPVDYEHVTCGTISVAALSAGLTWTNPDQIEVNIAAGSWSVDQTSFKLAYQAESSTEWTDLGTLALGVFPYTFTAPTRESYRVRLISICNGIDMDPVISNYVCPDTPQLSFVAAGTTLTITEKTNSEIANNQTASDTSLYRIVLTSLSGGGLTVNKPKNDMVLTELHPNTIYTAQVTLICDVFNDILAPTTRTFSFLTGNESQITCQDVPFTAYIQDCELENPVDPIDPKPTCQLAGQEWGVLNAIFIKDPSNTGNTDYYLEATVALNNASLAGVDTLMPGGVAAVITTVGCRPLISTNLEVALVSGATGLVGAGATVTNDGNININGTYTSNGAGQLIVRIRGTYNYA